MGSGQVGNAVLQGVQEGVGGLDGVLDGEPHEVVAVGCIEDGRSGPAGEDRSVANETAQGRSYAGVGSGGHELGYARPAQGCRRVGENTQYLPLEARDDDADRVAEVHANPASDLMK